METLLTEITKLEAIKLLAFGKPIFTIPENLEKSIGNASMFTLDFSDKRLPVSLQLAKIKDKAKIVSIEAGGKGEFKYYQRIEIEARTTEEI